MALSSHTIHTIPPKKRLKTSNTIREIMTKCDKKIGELFVTPNVSQNM